MKTSILEIIKWLFRVLGYAASLFNINPFFTNLVRSSVYSGYYSSRLKYLGRGSHILKTINLIGGKYISIDSGFVCLGNLRLEAFEKHLNKVYSPVISIGKNVGINFDCHIGAINRIVIGDNVLLASKVFITDHSHGDTTMSTLKNSPSRRTLISKGPVIIGNNVWVGEGVAIMPNVTIGENCIIGANAVVTKDIPANCVAAGIPAKVIKVIS